LQEEASNRYDVIDVLRGVAILLVVIRHVQLRIPFEEANFLMHVPEQVINAIFISGNKGVRIFFVISGFIITMTSLNRYSDLRRIDVKQFYLFRFARIAPCLIGLLAILTALHFLGIKGYLPGSWDVLWSLSVEEVFYFAFPIVCLVSKRKEFLYIVLVMLIITGPFYRLSLEEHKIWQSKAYLSCMDSIAMVRY